MSIAADNERALAALLTQYPYDSRAWVFLSGIVIGLEYSQSSRPLPLELFKEMARTYGEELFPEET